MEEKYIPILTEENLMHKIHIIRGIQVILDFDLAAIYGYETRYFNRQISNNSERFDSDFRFQLSTEEFHNLMCKNFTSSWGANVDITLKTTGGIYHDRYIIIDHSTDEEKIFHCGGSSKDGGKRITSITKVEDVILYKDIIGNLQHNPSLQL